MIPSQTLDRTMGITILLLLLSINNAVSLVELKTAFCRPQCNFVKDHNNAFRIKFICCSTEKQVFW